MSAQFKIRPAEQVGILDLCRKTKASLVLVPDLLEMFRKHIALDDLNRLQAPAERTQPMAVPGNLAAHITDGD